MALKYYKLPAHPSEVTDAELQHTLGDKPDSQVMRSLLMAEIAAVKAGAERETRTMRNLWYSLVKPALSRAGILNKTTAGGRKVAWDAKLSKYLAELVRCGETTYEELRIVDGSRQRQTATSITHPIAYVQLVGAHFPWVILFTEKDTMWGEVERIASLYGVSAISGGGQPSNACTENTIRAIVRERAFQEGQPESMILLALTDYDPFGYSIANAQYVQIAETLGSLADELENLPQVQGLRIGLAPDQLTPEERQQNAYEPTDEGLEAWFAETGGVDGQPLGLELDALPLSRVRRMFADAIEQHVDLERRREDLRTAYLDLIACEILQPDFEARRRKLQAAIRNSDLWQEIAGTDIPPDMFRRAAGAGWDSINPVDDWDPFGCADQVRELMKKAAA